MAIRLLLAALLLACLACNKGADLEGTWEAPVKFLGQTGSQTITFGDDGRFHSVTKLAYPNGVSMTATDKGKWTRKNDQLTMTFEDVDWKFAGPDPAAVEKGTLTFQNNKATIIKEANQNPTMKIIFEGRDKVTVSGQDEPRTYTRKS